MHMLDLYYCTNIYTYIDQPSEENQAQSKVSVDVDASNHTGI